MDNTNIRDFSSNKGKNIGIDKSPVYRQARELTYKRKLAKISLDTVTKARDYLAGMHQYGDLYTSIDRMFEAKKLEERDGDKAAHYNDTIKDYKKLERTLSNMQPPIDSSLATLRDEIRNASTAIEGTQSTSTRDNFSDSSDYNASSDSSDSEDYEDDDNNTSDKSSKIEKSPTYRRAEKILFKYKLKNVNLDTVNDAQNHAAGMNEDISKKLHEYIDKICEAKVLEEKASKDGKEASHYLETIQDCKELEKTLSNMQLPTDSPLVKLRNELRKPSDSLQKDSAEAFKLSQMLQVQVKPGRKYCAENIEKVKDIGVLHEEGQRVCKEYISSDQMFQGTHNGPITSENFAQFIEATVKLDKFSTKLKAFIGYKDVVDQMSDYNKSIAGYNDDWKSYKESEQQTTVEKLDKIIKESNSLKKELGESLRNYDSNPAKAAKDLKNFRKAAEDLKMFNDELKKLSQQATERKINNIIVSLNGDSQQFKGQALKDSQTIANLLKHFSHCIKNEGDITLSYINVLQDLHSKSPEEFKDTDGYRELGSFLYE